MYGGGGNTPFIPRQLPTSRNEDRFYKVMLVVVDYVVPVVQVVVVG